MNGKMVFKFSTFGAMVMALTVAAFTGDSSFMMGVPVGLCGIFIQD